MTVRKWWVELIDTDEIMGVVKISLNVAGYEETPVEA